MSSRQFPPLRLFHPRVGVLKEFTEIPIIDTAKAQHMSEGGVGEGMPGEMAGIEAMEVMATVGAAIGGKVQQVAEGLKQRSHQMEHRQAEMEQQTVTTTTTTTTKQTTTAPSGSRLGQVDPSQRSIIDLVKRDHEAVKLLYGQYLDANTDELKKAKVYTLIYEMSKHGHCEELILYPSVDDPPPASHLCAVSSADSPTPLSSSLYQVPSSRRAHPGRI